MTLHNNTGFNSVKVAKRYGYRNYQNSPVLATPLSFEAPFAIEPPRISGRTLYRLKLESMSYISAADNMGLRSVKFS